MVAVDSKSGVVVLIIDLSAAFDTVSHSLLLNILFREIGLRGNALRWFKSFLLNRSQRVKVGDTQGVQCIPSHVFGLAHRVTSQYHVVIRCSDW